MLQGIVLLHGHWLSFCLGKATTMPPPSRQVDGRTRGRAPGAVYRCQCEGRKHLAGGGGRRVGGVRGSGKPYRVQAAD